MRLGINLPTRHPDGSAPNAAEIMDRARMVEDAGFDGIWMSETVGRGDRTAPDSLQWLTVAACATQRVDIGTAITQVPLRPPLELAQRFMTLQALSGGRFTAGLGAGSTAQDFAAVGVDFDQRFRLLREGAATVKRLLAGETVDGNTLRPWPDVAGGPPLVIGAWGSGRWVARAAREYDGWMASGMNSSFRVIEEGMRRYREAGGSGRTLVATVFIDLRAEDRPLDPDVRFDLICPPEEAKARLQRIADLGFSDVLIAASQQGAGEWPTRDDLDEIRSLVPRESGAGVK